jgi:HEAT repeat protein
MNDLRSKNPQIREQAARQSGQQRDHRAVEALIQCLTDRVVRVQVAAAEALGNIGDERAIPALIASLNGDTYRLTEGDGSPGTYFEILKSAAFALGKIGSDPARQALLERYKSSDGSAVAAAVVGLGQIKDEHGLELILAALRHRDHFVRLHAARVLGDWGDRRAVKPLITALKDTVWVVQIAAAESLGTLRDARAAQSLQAIYQDVTAYLPSSPNDEFWRTEISIHLRAQAARGLALLNDTRFESDFRTRIGLDRIIAAMGLAYRNDARGFETLLQAIYDKKQTALQIEAAKALAFLADPSVIPVFQALRVSRYIPVRVLDEINRLSAQLPTKTPQPAGWIRQQVHALLCGLLDNSVDVVTGCRRLTQLYHYGYTWIPSIFVGLDSELDIVPPPDTDHQWNPHALARKLEEAEPIIASYRSQAQAEARKVLDEYFSDSPCP